MKKKVKVGIPRALLYYRYNVLWKTFLSNIGCQVIVSPSTNKNILSIGVKESVDESCLSYKIWLGHVEYLVNKCDYILIPRIENYGKNKKVCAKYNALPDIIKNKHPNVNILSYNIENNRLKYQFLGFIKMGLKINKNIFKIILSYIKAIKKQTKYNNVNYNHQKNMIHLNGKKVLIISHPYNVYDKYIGSSITDYLTENNIKIIYADKLEQKTAIDYSKELSPTLYWLYSQELIGAINYYKNIIDGIIFISTFPCGVDSLVNELMLRKVLNVPKLNLIIDESTTDVGLLTRLESFVDIIKGENNE